MDKQSLSRLPLRQLRQLARNHQIRIPAGMHKLEIVELMAASLGDLDVEIAQPLEPQTIGGVNPAVPELIRSGGCGTARGLLELQPDGYGFLRALDDGQKDVYVSIAQVRRFSLREGDLVSGVTRPLREGERYLAMLYIESINGQSPEQAAHRKHFDELTPVYPREQLMLEQGSADGDLALRLIDLMAPIGKGQRGLIVSPPKAGKTTLIKKIASAIAAFYPQMELYVLLLDERPEEVTDLKRSIRGEIFFSTFDDPPQHHRRLAEETLEKAKRQVECGRDVVLLVDSLTRLARASNLSVPSSGRLLSGGLDPAAIALPKRLFGAARQVEEGGSLTVLATALIDTGSRLDDVIYEEFKGTGNMELHLDRRLQEKRVFPALNLYRSGTRREEDLLTPEALSVSSRLRRILSQNPEEATELLIDLMGRTATNEEFIARFDGWIARLENGGKGR